MVYEADKSLSIYEAVMKGDADIRAGRTTRLTPELMQQLLQEGFEQAKARKLY